MLFLLLQTLRRWTTLTSCQTANTIMSSCLKICHTKPVSIQLQQVLHISCISRRKNLMHYGIFECWKENSRLRPKLSMKETLGNVLICSKINKQIGRKSTGMLNQCNQNHGKSLVYITRNCDLCILLITLRLTLKSFKCQS